MFIISLAGPAPCRCRPLSSNVRQHATKVGEHGLQVGVGSQSWRVFPLCSVNGAGRKGQREGTDAIANQSQGQRRGESTFPRRASDTLLSAVRR